MRLKNGSPHRWMCLRAMWHCRHIAGEHICSCLAALFDLVKLALVDKCVHDDAIELKIKSSFSVLVQVRHAKIDSLTDLVLLWSFSSLVFYSY